jgi:hypothetical protein
VRAIIPRDPAKTVKAVLQETTPMIGGAAHFHKSEGLRKRTGLHALHTMSGARHYSQRFM